MNPEQPPVQAPDPTPEEQFKIEQQRIEHQAQMLKQGATFEDGVFTPTAHQIHNAHREMERDLFSRTQDHATLQERAEKLRELETILGEVHMGHSMMRAAQEFTSDARAANDERFTQLLEEEGLTYPETHEDGVALYNRVRDMSKSLKGTMEMLSSFPQLRTGVEIKVRRSNGEVEGGWEIADFDLNGTARVINRAQGLEKSGVSIIALAELNPTEAGTSQAESTPDRSSQEAIGTLVGRLETLANSDSATSPQETIAQAQEIVRQVLAACSDHTELEALASKCQEYVSIYDEFTRFAGMGLVQQPAIADLNRRVGQELRSLSERAGSS